MGSSFGLYCPPESRLVVSGPHRRAETFTPLHLKIVPSITEFPYFLRESLLDSFDERAMGFEPGRFEGARDWLVGTVAALEAAHLSIGFDFARIQDRASDLAARAHRLKTLPLIKRMAELHQLSLPLGNRESTDDSIAARCYEPKTWRRSCERSYTRAAENKLREIGFIERGGMLYCSDLALQWYVGKMRAQVAWLKSRAVTDGAVQLPLFDVVQKSLSNKSNRRTELMTRMRGFEDYAKEAKTLLDGHDSEGLESTGHVATFFTLTCPSRFHARTVIPGRGAVHNERYQGATVREAQSWLSTMWARSRSRLAKLQVTIYGFRIAEPHHDGTPHWHLVLFCAPHHRGLVWAVLRSRWLSEDGTEPGALARRATAICVESAKGSATGYIAKYIAKNIDGFETGELTSDEDNKTTLQNAALRVTAWASIHGIRQFQQIGGPAIGPYRECRRVRNHCRLGTIEPLRQAADTHDFGRFIQLNGGIEAGRRGAIRPWTEKTGEINAYGEVRGPEVVGVMSVSEALQTRTKQWRIVKCGTSSQDAWSGSPSASASPSGPGAAPGRNSESDSALGPVSITVPGAPALSDPFGWTNPNETSTYGPH